MKLYLLLIIFILLSFQAKAQLNSSPEIPVKVAKRDWEVSFFIHRPFSTISDIRSSMMTSGAAGSSSSDSTGSTVNVRTPISYAFKYNISQRSGITFGTGRLDAFTIDPDENFPKVNGILSAIFLDYVHSFGRNRHELSSGISLMSFRMKPRNGKNSITPSNAKTKKTGINFGYAYHVIEAKGFFLALQAQYTLSGLSSIGPYTITSPQHNIDLLGLGTIVVPATHTSFPAAKVNLSTFNMGISMGFRFGEVKRRNTVQVK